jgi:hypothetical protein
MEVCMMNIKTRPELLDARIREIDRFLIQVGFCAGYDGHGPLMDERRRLKAYLRIREEQVMA